MRQDQKSWDEYHKWDKEFCTDAAPTYWECWQAACATMQKQISRLEADFNDAIIERNNAEKREYEALGRANALEVANKFAARMESDAQERADCLLPASHERDEAINILVRFAEGLTTHTYSGACPSDESPKSRDSQCVVCWAIDAARAAKEGDQHG